jgi:hypothetical protein
LSGVDVAAIRHHRVVRLSWWYRGNNRQIAVYMLFSELVAIIVLLGLVRPLWRALAASAGFVGAAIGTSIALVLTRPIVELMSLL